MGFVLDWQRTRLTTYVRLSLSCPPIWKVFYERHRRPMISVDSWFGEYSVSTILYISWHLFCHSLFPFRQMLRVRSDRDISRPHSCSVIFIRVGPPTSFLVNYLIYIPGFCIDFCMGVHFCDFYRRYFYIKCFIVKYR